MFCGVIIKFDFCRKNSAKMLTFKMSNINSNYRKMFIQWERKEMRISRRGIYTRNYTRKSPENVYMMKKNGYNKYH